ncbi:MAG: PKD domain-containing protein [Chloroflexota bacterium]|nr:MAG: PKD domain-containing protein [Chloroflexota bacterium]
MRYIRRNISPIKYLPISIISLLLPALLLTSACLAPTPPPPPPPPTNQPPVISSLTAQNEVMALSESNIVCEANDPDSDNLTYQWSANSGNIKGEGSAITWVAPDATGTYTIKVTVSDGEGLKTSKSATIIVVDKPNQPPVITGLTKDGSPPDEENRVREWRTITIHCNAEDPDGDALSYLWRATRGKVNGEGSTVLWTAPGVTGDCTITVVVTDGRGGKAEASIVFKVACCGGGY